MQQLLANPQAVKTAKLVATATIPDVPAPKVLATFGRTQITANSTTSEQVKVVLKRRMASGRPELAEIARELGMSERTLQRRITDDGTTYRQLLEEARRELGRQMLGTSSEIDEIAYLLGYQDTSSFYRAFREWEGVTPSQWREREMLGQQTMH